MLCYKVLLFRCRVGWNLRFLAFFVEIRKHFFYQGFVFEFFINFSLQRNQSYILQDCLSYRLLQEQILTARPGEIHRFIQVAFCSVTLRSAWFNAGLISFCNDAIS